MDGRVIDLMPHGLITANHSTYRPHIAISPTHKLHKSSCKRTTLFTGRRQQYMSLPEHELSEPALKRVKLSRDTEVNEYENLNDSETLNGRSDHSYDLKLTIQAHDKAISAIKISPDGISLASSSADATLKIWNLRTGALENTLTGHSKGLSDVSWSSNSQYLASASDDRSIRIWSIHSGRALRVLKGHTHFVLCSVFNPAGNLVASGSFDESIKIWDIRTGECLKTLPAHNDPVSSVQFNVDGTMLVSCSHDGLIRIWDTASGQCLKTLSDQDSPPMSFVSFSPNGKFLLSCTLDSTIRLWNFVSSKPMKTYKGHVNVKYTINAEMSNHEVVTGGEDGRITIWDTQSKEVRQVVSDSDEVLLSVSRHKDTGGTQWLASAGLDKVIRIYAKPASSRF